jgi:hypothetical protein
MMTSKIVTTATPLPIPAFAPVLSPEFDEAAAGLGVCDALAVGDVPVEGVIMEKRLALARIAEEDGVGVGPTVAASWTRLEVILQQDFSPQHQRLSPHFWTGALSACHYRIISFLSMPSAITVAHLCKISHILEATLALPCWICTPLSPPILHARICSVKGLEVLA